MAHICRECQRTDFWSSVSEVTHAKGANILVSSTKPKSWVFAGAARGRKYGIAGFQRLTAISIGQPEGRTCHTSISIPIKHGRERLVPPRMTRSRNSKDGFHLTGTILVPLLCVAEYLPPPMNIRVAVVISKGLARSAGMW